MGTTKSVVNWRVVYDTWRSLGKPLDSETLLQVRATAGRETAYAIAVAQEVVPAVLRWMIAAYPDAKYPPPAVPNALLACLERYGKAAYRRHRELEQWGLSWREYLMAQTDIVFRHADAPNLWTVFNNVGLERYNRLLSQRANVDGQDVVVLSQSQARALSNSARWEELVDEWESGRFVISRTLTTCPGLSSDAAVLLENHLLGPAFLIADSSGINAIDSGFLPRQKADAALNLLVELERDKYTARKFYSAVIEKGAVL